LFTYICTYICTRREKKKIKGEKEIG